MSKTKRIAIRNDKIADFPLIAFRERGALSVDNNSEPCRLDFAFKLLRQIEELSELCSLIRPCTEMFTIAGVTARNNGAIVG